MATLERSREATERRLDIADRQIADVEDPSTKEIHQALRRVEFLEHIGNELGQLDMGKVVGRVLELNKERQMHINLGIRQGFTRWNAYDLGIEWGAAEMSPVSTRGNPITLRAKRTGLERLAPLPRMINASVFVQMLNQNYAVVEAIHQLRHQSLHGAIQTLPVLGGSAAPLYGGDNIGKMRFVLSVSKEPFARRMTSAPTFLYDSPSSGPASRQPEWIGPVLHLWQVQNDEHAARRSLLSRLGMSGLLVPRM